MRDCKCFICGDQLTDANTSDEHILLNALGGRLCSRELLCKKCNEEIGRGSDKELANELNFFASLLNISRQRGKNQIIRTADEKYDLLPGGMPVLKKPIISKEDIDHGFRLEIEARNEIELRKILAGYAKQYPGIDVEKAIQTKKEQTKHVDTIRVPREFHASRIYPSMIKSAAEYFLYCGGEQKHVEHLIQTIKEVEGGERYCRYFYPLQKLFSLDQKGIYHVLYVRGSSAEHLLYGYISYFDVVQCLVLLNDDYKGSDIESSYIYNAVNKETVIAKPNYILLPETIQNAFAVPYNELAVLLSKQVEEFLKTAGIIRVHHKIDPELNSYIKEQFKEYQDGVIDAKELSARIACKSVSLYEPWLKRNI